jgi:COP9 signalosome complex subunit 1
MATVFSTPVKDLELEVASLIEEDILNCRIDSHNKVLREREIDLRSSTVSKCYETGDEFECVGEFMLMKMRLLNAGMVVKDEQGIRSGDGEGDAVSFAEASGGALSGDMMETR